eukprot:362536-Chlamydomonas_euryale.AAC.13
MITTPHLSSYASQLNTSAASSAPLFPTHTRTPEASAAHPGCAPLPPPPRPPPHPQFAPRPLVRVPPRPLPPLSRRAAAAAARSRAPLRLNAWPTAPRGARPGGRAARRQPRRRPLRRAPRWLRRARRLPRARLPPRRAPPPRPRPVHCPALPPTHTSHRSRRTSHRRDGAAANLSGCSHADSSGTHIASGTQISYGTHIASGTQISSGTHTRL